MGTRFTRWEYVRIRKEREKQLAAALGIMVPTARILIARGMDDEAACRRFLAQARGVTPGAAPCRNKPPAPEEAKNKIPLPGEALQPGKRIIVYDLETTGLDPDKEAIIEIAGVALLDGKTVEQFSTLANPGKKLDPYITELTGIREEDLLDAPPEQFALNRFLEFLDNADFLAGHNIIDFDNKFMCARLGHSFPDQALTCIDTLPLSRRLLPELQNHKLITVLQHFNYQESGYHRALADARASAHALLQLFALVRERYPVEPDRGVEPQPVLAFETLIDPKKFPVAALLRELLSLGPFEEHNPPPRLMLQEVRPARVGAGILAIVHGGARLEFTLPQDTDPPTSGILDVVITLEGIDQEDAVFRGTLLDWRRSPLI